MTDKILQYISTEMRCKIFAVKFSINLVNTDQQLTLKHSVNNTKHVNKQAHVKGTNKRNG